MKHARRQARLYLNHVVYQMVKSQMIKEPMYQAARFVYIVYIDNYVWKVEVAREVINQIQTCASWTCTVSFSKDFFSQGAVNKVFLSLFHWFLY